MADLVYVGGTDDVGRVLVVHDAAAALPVPTLATDGAALEPLTTGVVNTATETVRGLPETLEWRLTNGGTLVAPVFWVYFGDGVWRPVGSLAAGDIVGNAAGRIDCGASWQRVVLVGTPSAPITFDLVREERATV